MTPNELAVVQKARDGLHQATHGLSLDSSSSRMAQTKINYCIGLLDALLESKDWQEELEKELGYESVLLKPKKVVPLHTASCMKGDDGGLSPTQL